MGNKVHVTDSQKKERTGRGKRKWILPAVLIGIAVVICLLLRSCRARDEPFLIDTPERVYEENVTVEKDVTPSPENKRLNLAISDSYRISEEHPLFYIGFPEENIYDVILTIKGDDGEELYKTNYIAPGTNVAIDGTAFLEKGKHKLNCLVSIYNHDTGMLVSDCTTVVLNLNYE